MRPIRLLKPLSNAPQLHFNTTPQWTSLTVLRSCSCSRTAPLGLSATKPLLTRISTKQPRGSQNKNPEKNDPPDHRAIGTAQSLFTTHLSSPGAPFFQPDGTHIFQKLVSFLRAQYPSFGFSEVLTPTIYKETLWKQSGHWENYKDDMFTVTGNTPPLAKEGSTKFVDERVQLKHDCEEASKLEEYGLKPMNCPGHCLLYKSQQRSYKQLPIRYAEFSSLHRNEVSGALSGLTRVRRFHQDDGHIFCRPSQIRAEIEKALAFVELVYKTLGVEDYRFVLSTRPEKDYIGTQEEWDRAEGQLREVLNKFEHTKTEKGAGAFYGPKIDVVLRDSDGKKHQTGTIQLDFQLPKRFELEYDSPAAELEAKGENWEESESRTVVGKVAPVMIHRAVLGSLERFMALLLETSDGQLPFWLNPKQIIILTVNNEASIQQYAEKARYQLQSRENTKGQLSSDGTYVDVLPKSLDPPLCVVDIDTTDDTLALKVVRAKKKKYNIIAVVGRKNSTGVFAGTLDLDVSAQPNKIKIWNLINSIKPGTQAPKQMDKGTGAKYRGISEVRLTIAECKRFIRGLNDSYF